MWRLQQPLRILRLQSARKLSTASVLTESRRILCVNVPQFESETSCIQELVQRGHRVDQLHSDSDLNSVAIEDYDALLVSPDTALPLSLLQKGARAKLQMVAVPADKVDTSKIDMMEATNQGLLVLQLEKKQVSDKFSVEAAIGMGLLLNVARHIPASIATIRSGEPYAREQFKGTELCGKKLGIIGLAQAGKCVVEMAHAMGMQVFGYDPNLTHESAELMGVRRLNIDELYASCDILAFHAPLTGKTRGIFDDKALDMCKDGVKIVSVAEYKGRNGLLNQDALLRGLESGKISGLALDFLGDQEDGEATADVCETWKKIASHENVITQTHFDGKSSNDVELAKKYRTIAENVCDALALRYYRGVANGVFMPLTLQPEMKPFLELSEAIGRFLFEITVSSDPKDKISKVMIATSGGLQVDITSPRAKSALQSAVMKGAMASLGERRRARQFDTPNITLLNSSLVAMTNGIDVRQGEVEGPELQHLNNSITVEVETKAKVKHLIMGSVFGEDPRIVRVNEYTDFPAFRPSGNLLMFKNQDKPGAIAGILNELSRSQINIANFGLSRQDNVEHALGILSLDQAPSEDTLERLRKLPTLQSLQFATV